jgi:hypothetical protein
MVPFTLLVGATIPEPRWTLYKMYTIRKAHELVQQWHQATAVTARHASAAIQACCACCVHSLSWLRVTSPKPPGSYQAIHGWQ